MGRPAREDKEKKDLVLFKHKSSTKTSTVPVEELTNASDGSIVIAGEKTICYL